MCINTCGLKPEVVMLFTAWENRDVRKAGSSALASSWALLSKRWASRTGPSSLMAGGKLDRMMQRAMAVGFQGKAKLCTPLSWRHIDRLAEKLNQWIHRQFHFQDKWQFPPVVISVPLSMLARMQTQMPKPSSLQSLHTIHWKLLFRYNETEYNYEHADPDIISIIKYEAL